MSTTTKTGSTSTSSRGPSSSRWSLVALREISVRLRDKGFIFGTLLSVVLILGAIALPFFLGGNDATTYKVAVTGEEGSTVAQQAEPLLAAQTSPFDGEDAEPPRIETVSVADRDAAEQGVVDGEADVALVQEDGGWQLLSDGSPPTQLAAALSQVVQSTALAQNAADAGTSLEELTAGGTLEPVDVSGADGEDSAGLMNVILGVVFGMLFYMAALMFGLQIAQSVVEEKQSRIVEILAAMIPVRQLLIGKVLGNTVMAFLQIAIIAAVSLVGLSFTDMSLDLGGLTEAILWYIPFFVLGFLALACIWAAAGALASRNEDVQNTTMPLTMMLVVVFIASLQLTGTAREIVSFVPVASTIVMPMRILEGDYQMWEPLLALVLVLIFCGLTIVFGARMYERAVMHTSGTLSWGKALRMKD